MLPDYARVSAWCVDMMRAVNERPAVFRWIWNLSMGRWARAELRGLNKALLAAGLDPTYDYDLKSMDYHRRAVQPRGSESTP